LPDHSEDLSLPTLLEQYILTFEDIQNRLKSLSSLVHTFWAVPPVELHRILAILRCKMGICALESVDYFSLIIQILELLLEDNEVNKDAYNRKLRDFKMKLATTPEAITSSLLDDYIELNQNMIDFFCLGLCSNIPHQEDEHASKSSKGRWNFWNWRSKIDCECFDPGSRSLLNLLQQMFINSLPLRSCPCVQFISPLILSVN
jgi:hypothetical protein